MDTHLRTPIGTLWCGSPGLLSTSDPQVCTCAACINEVFDHADCCPDAARMIEALSEISH